MRQSDKFSDLSALAIRTGMDRRRFMTSAVALGASAAAATSLWSGVAQATPTRGGHVRLGLDGGATGDTLNPALSIGADHVTSASMASFDTLTEISPDGAPAGNLAESWEVSADGKSWAFKLRRGAEFHNGKTVTSADVVWSLQQHLGEDATFPDGKQIIGNLEVLKADGPDTVVMVQKEVNFDLPAHLTSPGLFIGPEGATDWNAAIGSGPYKMTRWEPGVAFEAERYANFYRDDQAYFDSIELLAISDPAARVNAMLTGSVDVIGQPDAKVARRLGHGPISGIPNIWVM